MEKLPSDAQTEKLTNLGSGSKEAYIWFGKVACKLSGCSVSDASGIASGSRNAPKLTVM